MFLRLEDLPSVIYDYQLEQITEGDDDITLQALAAAEEEARSYLTPNNKPDFMDGRLVYDVDAVFSATGDQRNELILRYSITIAKWHLIDLCQMEILYETAKERYDRAVEWFDKLSKGDVNLSSLPLLDRSSEAEAERTPFSMGSRQKFNHEL